MRILITLDFPPEQGGIQRYLYNLVKYTFNVSDRVLVGSTEKNKITVNSLPCRVHYYSTTLSKINKKVSLILLFFVLIKNVPRCNDQLTIEAGNIYSAIPVFLLSLMRPVKYLVYCYGKELLPLKTKGWKRFLFRKILNRAEKICYITQHTASLLSCLNLDHKLCHLPPKIDNSLLADIANKGLHDPIHLLSVGRLEKHKGHAVLVDAVAGLPKTMKWKLTIAGSGPQFSSLYKQISDYSLNEKIYLTGAISDQELWKLYQNADIFLFPSQKCENSTEGFGIVLLEAMAKGLTILASRVGGIPEVLDNGSCGVLLPYKNTEAWTNGIIEVARNNVLRKKLLVNARSHVEKYYVWK